MCLGIFNLKESVSESCSEILLVGPCLLDVCCVPAADLGTENTAVGVES